MPTREELEEMSQGGSNQGFCLECEEWTTDSIDDNDSNEICPDCGNYSVHGATTLLNQGFGD